MTVPENQWGYHKDWSLELVKTLIEVIDRIVHAVSMGGNIVVNFGPSARWRFPFGRERVGDGIGVLDEVW